MRRFFVSPDDIQDNLISIRGDEARHIQRVLRMEPGETIAVCDGTRREYRMVITSCTVSEVIGTVAEYLENPAEPGIAVTLVQGIAKGDRMEQIIQKAVELGVSNIVPVISEHTVVQLSGDRCAERLKRWNRVSLEACKQCGRSQPPPVSEVCSLVEVLTRWRGRPGIVCHEGHRDTGLRAAFASMRAAVREQGLLVFVGPEGGYSRGEVDLAREMGFAIAGLGPRVLRTETASLAALAIVMFESGEMGG
jgi:16S rRNA (uracil1498-N3)-methyltransferase